TPPPPRPAPPGPRRTTPRKARARPSARPAAGPDGYAGQPLEAARFAIRLATAALVPARVAFLVAPRRRAAPIEQLGIAEHRAFLVELAQLRRIELDEHASRVHHVGIELDRDAAFAQHQRGGGAHLFSPGADD